jgi:plastocyanin
VLKIQTGDVVTFVIDAPGNPFGLYTDPSVKKRTGTLYNDGVAGQPTEDGVVVWKVSSEAPRSLWYQSSTNPDLFGRIEVENAVTETIPDSGVIHRVNVGEGGNAFNPNAFTVNLGDKIEFTFVAPGHTVDSVATATSCSPDLRFSSNGVQPAGTVMMVDVQPINGFTQADQTVYFVCLPHCAQMKGAIGVQTAAVGPNSGAYPPLLIAHAVLMSLSWGLFAVLGFYAATFRHMLGAKWFTAHWVALGLAFALLICGFGVIVAHVEQTGQGHFGYLASSRSLTAHPILGLIIFIVTCVQVVMGFVANRLWQASFKKSDGVVPDKNVVDYIHIWTGRGLLLLSIAQIFLGVFEMYLATWINAIFAAWYAIWAVLVVVGLVSKKSAREKEAQAAASMSASKPVGKQFEGSKTELDVK